VLSFGDILPTKATVSNLDGVVTNHRYCWFDHENTNDNVYNEIDQEEISVLKK